MAQPPSTEFDDLSAPDKHLVNEVCARFESALREGHSPPLAEHLSGITEQLRPILFAELLRLECEYRHPPNTDRPAGQVGPFVVGDELGRGGFAAVYRATDTRDGRACALKIPLPAALADPRFRERFLREAEAASRLDHPNVVRTHEVGADGLVCYLAAEYIAGPTLAAWLEERRARAESVPASVAAELVAALAGAVQHAHGRGVLHRDLKPANVLLEAASGASIPTPKVTDFGLARLADDDTTATRSGLIVGTPAYMAPEQVTRRHPVSVATDVHALGAILYELLAGRSPFAAPSSLEMLFLVARDEPPALRALHRGVPADLEAVCLKCLEKDPARRYESAQALADDLHRFLVGRRTRVRPPGPLRRSARWARRHPVAAILVGAASVLVTVSAAGLLLHTWQLQAVNASLTAALVERDASNRGLRRTAYAAAIRRAAALLDRGGVGDAKRLLAEWEPTGDAEDLRGWEWHYLRDLAGRHEVVTWPAGTLYSLSYSPDGQALAGAGADHQIRLWDPATGRELLSPLAHPSEVNEVVWAPDGRWLATACDDGIVRVWPRAGGVPVALAGHEGPIKSLAVSPDGRSLASLGADRLVNVWDVGRGEATTRIDTRQLNVARSVAFSPEGQSVLVGSEIAGKGPPTSRVYVFDRSSGVLRHDLVTGLAGPVHVIRADVARNRVLTIGRQEVRGWDWAVGSGGLVQKFALPQRDYRINDAALGPGGRLLAVAGDSAVRVWDLDAQQVRHQFYGHDGRVWAVAFRPDGRALATAGADGTVRLWDVQESPNQVDITGALNRVSLLPGVPRVAVVRGKSARLEVWDIGSEGPAHRATRPADDIGQLAAAPDGRGLVGMTNAGRVLRWDLGTEGAGGELFPRRGPTVLAPVELFRLPGKAAAMTGLNHSLAVSSDSRQVAAAFNLRAHVWDADTCRVTTLTGTRREVSALAAHRDGRTLAGAGVDGIRLWDMVNGELRYPPIGPGKGGQTLAFSPDGSLLAASGEDQLIRLWDLDGGLRVTCAGHRGPVQALAFAPDGLTLASGSADGTIRLWQVSTGSELLALDGTGESVYLVGFSSDGRYLVHAARAAQTQGREMVGWYDRGEGSAPR